MKFRKALSLILAMSMAFTLFACKDQKKSGKRSDSDKKTEETDEKKSSKTKETKETEETEETDETPDIVDVSFVPDYTAQYPDKGCDIPLKPEELCYHYDMDLTLDTDANTIGGHVVFSFYNDSADDWDKLCFRDYSSLFKDGECIVSRPTEQTISGNEDEGSFEMDGEITEIKNLVDKREDKDLEFTRDEDVSVIWVDLDETLGSGERMTIEYDFVSKIPSLPDRYGVYEGIYCVTNFYPILAEYVDGDWSRESFYDVGECFYSEVSDYEVDITVPEGFEILSTGEEKSSEENDGNVTYSYTARSVRDFVFSASDVFEMQTREFDGVKVNVAINKDSTKYTEKEAVYDAAFLSAENSLKTFGESFGKYPYEELDIIFSPIAAGGMEYPNLIIINDDYCEEDYYTMSKYDILINCVAHEIGHQWFMGIVGSNSGAQPWLDESVTSYTELVYAEDNKYSMGVSDLISNSPDVMDLSEIKEAYPSSFPLGLGYIDYENDFAYILSVYYFGETFLYQVELEVGQDEFRTFLRDYVQKFAFRNADAEDFFEVFYAHFGRDNERINELVDLCFGE